MPTLKQLSCHLEWNASKTPLPEYCNAYADGVVQTYVTIPSTSGTFAIRLRSIGYIAPGLAMFVYMDGEYQCNRNRLNLKMPGNGIERSQIEVDFRVRQKEQKLHGGTWVGRDWRFEKLNIVSAGDSERHQEEISPDQFSDLGTIEVVVLRCHENPVNISSMPRDSSMSGDGRPPSRASSGFEDVYSIATLHPELDGVSEVPRSLPILPNLGFDGIWDDPATNGTRRGLRKWGPVMTGPNTGVYCPIDSPISKSSINRPKNQHEAYPTAILESHQANPQQSLPMATDTQYRELGPESAIGGTSIDPASSNDSNTPLSPRAAIRMRQAGHLPEYPRHPRLSNSDLVLLQWKGGNHYNQCKNNPHYDSENIFNRHLEIDGLQDEPDKGEWDHRRHQHQELRGWKNKVSQSRGKHMATDEIPKPQNFPSLVAADSDPGGPLDRRLYDDRSRIRGYPLRDSSSKTPLPKISISQYTPPIIGPLDFKEYQNDLRKSHRHLPHHRHSRQPRDMDDMHHNNHPLPGRMDSSGGLYGKKPQAIARNNAKDSWDTFVNYPPRHRGAPKDYTFNSEQAPNIEAMSEGNTKENNEESHGVGKTHAQQSPGENSSRDNLGFEGWTHSENRKSNHRPTVWETVNDQALAWVPPIKKNTGSQQEPVRWRISSEATDKNGLVGQSSSIKALEGQPSGETISHKPWDAAADEVSQGQNKTRGNWQGQTKSVNEPDALDLQGRIDTNKNEEAIGWGAEEYTAKAENTAGWGGPDDTTKNEETVGWGGPDDTTKNEHTVGWEQDDSNPTPASPERLEPFPPWNPPPLSNPGHEDTLDTSPQYTSSPKKGGSSMANQSHHLPTSKPYWNMWCKSRPGSTMADDVYIGAEDPPTPVPIDMIPDESISHQVRSGKPALYSHRPTRPQYMDNIESPYAVFIFKYRSIDALENLLGITVPETIVDPIESEKQRLLAMSKDDIINEMLKIQVWLQALFTSDLSFNNFVSKSEFAQSTLSTNRDVETKDIGSTDPANSIQATTNEGLPKTPAAGQDNDTQNRADFQHGWRKPNPISVLENTGHFQAPRDIWKSRPSPPSASRNEAQKPQDVGKKPSASMISSNSKKQPESQNAWRQPSASMVSSSSKQPQESQHIWNKPSSVVLSSSSKKPREPQNIWKKPSASVISGSSKKPQEPQSVWKFPNPSTTSNTLKPIQEQQEIWSNPKRSPWATKAATATHSRAGSVAHSGASIKADKKARNTLATPAASTSKNTGALGGGSTPKAEAKKNSPAQEDAWGGAATPKKAGGDWGGPSQTEIENAGNW
ncbi:MAG: hypothetical protein M1829_006949 [Trizodia sp. TS-e1964]|nr:MAG: hypothetical protein M1829_006949 [Trizodia sp. TS-e1964]